MDENAETFMVYVVPLSATQTMQVYLSRQTQVDLLPSNKAPTEILSKYSDYADVFLFHLAMGLPENIGMNKHAIKLIDGKQPSYRPIYALSLVELETLKA